ncbi:hypothetical protein ACIPEP_17960 [Curtobacterium sp. NPDC087082]|uniref:hypothetical protein n=1 Tax=Curtobacterium sp. NPDC087082 TaxID=3363966 RepID=UPI0037F99A15
MSKLTTCSKYPRAKKALRILRGAFCARVSAFNCSAKVPPLAAAASVATREFRARLRETLQRLATMPTSGESALYLFLRELGGPFLTLDGLPLEARAPAQQATEFLRIDNTDGTVRVPDLVRCREASGLGVGTRGTSTTDDGEGGEQVAVVWVFRAGGTDVRIATVANAPESFAVIEPEIDDFIDGISVLN